MIKNIIGVDVGGTKIQVGLMDQKYRVLKSAKFLTEAKKGKAAVINNIINAIAYFFTPSVKAIGLGITGEVDWQKGISVSDRKLRGWHNVPLARILQKKFKVPIYLDNDAKLFALCEAVLGAGEKYKYVVGITLGTGIGGGLVIDKKLYHGKDNAVTEFGHTVIEASSKIRCHCGHVGHFEAMVSGTAMRYWYKKFSGLQKSTYEIAKLARAGNRAAIKTFQIMNHYLAIGLANVINSLNPDIIVIGGGLSELSLLVNPAIKDVKKYLIFPGQKSTKIVRTKNIHQSVIRGAALITNPKYR